MIPTATIVTPRTMTRAGKILNWTHDLDRVLVILEEDLSHFERFITQDDVRRQPNEEEIYEENAANAISISYMRYPLWSLKCSHMG